MAKPFKKILCLDFDGVIHSYNSGWKGIDVIPDPPVEGAIAWIQDFLINHCTLPEKAYPVAPQGDWELHIYSARSRKWRGRRAMKKWLLGYGLDEELLQVIKFPKRKPAAYVTLDDRAIQFNGKFPMFRELERFKPWYKKSISEFMRDNAG